jgi:hypothetical protein
MKQTVRALPKQSEESVYAYLELEIRRTNEYFDGKSSRKMVFALLPTSLAVFFKFALLDLVQAGLDNAKSNHTG